MFEVGGSPSPHSGADVVALGSSSRRPHSRPHHLSSFVPINFEPQTSDGAPPPRATANR